MRLVCAVVLGAAMVPGFASGQVAAKKTDPGTLGGKWYGSAELRHHVNTYYDQEGYYERQDPSAHARLQLGAQFYEGWADAYVTFGVFKMPRTQQVMQRRPELALDLHPVRGEYFSLLQYNLVQLPVKAEASPPTTDDDKTDELSAGAVYTVGLAPTVKVPFVVGGSKLEVKTGLDGWTRLHSRRQYTDVYGVPGDDGAGEDGAGEDDRLGLAPDTGAETEPIEDYALHYQAQALAGLGYFPDFVKGLQAETSSHYHSHFEPRYERDEAGGVSHEYGAERYSYYRVRLRYEINERLTVTNDLYHFHDGLFAAKREGDERRFRNIARVSCKL